MTTKKKPETKIGINVGSNRDSIAEARGAINDILDSLADQSTKVVALETLKDLCKVNNTNITNCIVDQ